MTEGNSTTERIRELNEALRCHGTGGPKMITRGVLALGEGTIACILSEIARFDAFTPDNDPYGEHDCAVMQVDGVKILWKIDYYDKSMTGGSPDPSDPEVTERSYNRILCTALD